MSGHEMDNGRAERPSRAQTSPVRRTSSGNQPRNVRFSRERTVDESRRGSILQDRYPGVRYVEPTRIPGQFQRSYGPGSYARHVVAEPRSFVSDEFVTTGPTHVRERENLRSRLEEVNVDRIEDLVHRIEDLERQSQFGGDTRRSASASSSSSSSLSDSVSNIRRDARARNRAENRRRRGRYTDDPSDYFYTEIDPYAEEHPFTDEEESDLDSMLGLMVRGSSKEETLLPASKEADSKPSTKKGQPLPPNGKCNSVYLSEYTGDEFIDGEHSVNLTCSEEQGQKHKQLFRWIHIENQSTMDFNNFQKQILDIPTLADDEKHCILKLLARVPKKHAPSYNSSKTKSGPDFIIEHTFLEERLRSDKKKSKHESQRQAMVRFWCVPYLYLSKYSGIRSSPPSGSKLMPTLMQTRFAGSSEARDRLQASYQVLGKENELCFHVPQLWCLTVDNHLLVTSAHVSSDLLQGNIVRLTPSPRIPTIEPFLWVSYGQYTVWRLPLEDCKTWFALISHFWEFWLNDFRLYSQDKTVMQDDWPKFYSSAKSSGFLELTLQVGPSRTSKTKNLLLSSMARLRVLEPDIGGPLADVQPQPIKERLHVLECLCGRDLSNSSTQQEKLETNKKYLCQSLERIDHFLSHINSQKSLRNSKDVRSYQECTIKAHCDVQNLILCKYKSIDWESSSKDIAQERSSMMVFLNIFCSMEMLYQLFLPLNLDTFCDEKFWGGLHRFLQRNMYPSDEGSRRKDTRKSEEKVAMVAGTLEYLVERSQLLLEITSIVTTRDRELLNLPDKLVRAWTDLIMVTIHMESLYFDARWAIHTKNYGESIDTATIDLIYALPRKQLLSKSIVMPMDIGMLLTLQALKDFTGDQPDVEEIYSRYFARLKDSEISGNASKRVYQQSLLMLKHEVRTLKSTFNKQLEVVLQFCPASAFNSSRSFPYIKDSGARVSYEHEMYPLVSAGNKNQTSRLTRSTTIVNTQGAAHDLEFLEPSEDTASLVGRMSATNPGGMPQIFSKLCIDHTIKRQSAFDKLIVQIDYLNVLNDQKYNAGAERRELAVYAFTLVTVLFLPLGTIAAIFGINTQDMRNLEQNQWLFWSVAAPLSLIIIVGGLFWAGELGNAWNGFLSWFVPNGKQDMFMGTSSTKRTRAMERLHKEGIPNSDVRISTTGYHEDNFVTIRPERHIAANNYDHHDDDRDNAFYH